MTLTKRIICLANSRKYSGRCVAGIEIVDGKPGGWIRPVGNRDKEQLQDSECRYAGGAGPCVLDIIDVPLLAHKPNGHQPENWLIDPGKCWVKNARCQNASLERLAETGGTLWMNGYESKSGTNNQIPVAFALSIAGSLKLIRVESMAIEVSAPNIAFGEVKRNIRAKFKFAGAWYGLSVTDTAMETQYEAHDFGRYAAGPHYLTISVGEEFQGHFYKLVAAAIEVKS